MKIEGHIQNDYKRFNCSCESVHKHLDEHFGTDKFYEEQRHTLEYVMGKYKNPIDLRCAVFHLLDDFGGDLVMEKDWADTNHWLGQFMEDKAKTLSMENKKNGKRK